VTNPTVAGPVKLTGKNEQSDAREGKLEMVDDGGGFVEQRWAEAAAPLRRVSLSVGVVAGVSWEELLPNTRFSQHDDGVVAGVPVGFNK